MKSSKNLFQSSKHFKTVQSNWSSTVSQNHRPRRPLDVITIVGRFFDFDHET